MMTAMKSSLIHIKYTHENTKKIISEENESQKTHFVYSNQTAKQCNLKIVINKASSG